MKHFVKKSRLPEWLGFGTHNGYAIVPPSHPLHGVSYGAANGALDAIGVQIHGGLTFSGTPDEIDAPAWVHDDV